MLILKQSTAIDIRMGPFVDVGDAFTPETGVTIAASDQAEVLKANGAATVAMTGTFAAVTGADGWYDYTVAAGDVDTVGEVVFVMQDADVYLPVFVRGYVVEEAIYDALFAASAAAFDANQRVDVGEWLGTAVATPTVAGVPEVDVTHQGGGAIPAPAVTGVPDVNMTHHVDVAASVTNGELDVNVGQISGDSTAADQLEQSAKTIQLFTIDNTSFTATTTAAQVDAVTPGALEATNDHYIGKTIIFVSGALIYQATDITDYDGTNKRFTYTAVTEAPADNDTFIVV